VSATLTALRRRRILLFEIHNLVMRGLGDGDGATFDAALTNPTPRGEIVTHGTFGPWQTNDPRQTPVRGEYTFKSANLDTIKGIGGTLSSVGRWANRRCPEIGGQVHEAGHDRTHAADGKATVTRRRP
jgi:hypothetical protein